MIENMISDSTQPPVIAPPSRGQLWLLLRVRMTALRNMLHQAAQERPLKLLSIASSILLIWVGLYVLLFETFHILRKSLLEGIVATPLVFTFFFLALSAMLAFSNAILCYGSLFRRPDSAYLLSSPVRQRDVVLMKFIESLALSSWSLLLLGLPLMMAVARVFNEPWSFYPLFLGLFLLFIPLPGAIGMLLAWLVAILVPQSPRRALVMAMIGLGGIGLWWGWHLSQIPTTSATWLNDFYERIALLQGAMLPHTWVSKGINCALQDQVPLALFYLFVTCANALFASTIAVVIVSHGYTRAFARAQVSANKSVRRSAHLIDAIAEVLFAYLPRQLRILAGKDLKSFLRDPLQWSQMAILIGLLALYVSNAQRLWTDLSEPRLHLLIAFLNLTAISLILATFTSRFVFPLVSLDAQQLWFLGLAPLPRRRLIIAKFCYALTVTLLAAISVMGVSLFRLGLPRPLAITHIIAIVSICIGLCGVSIGMGARMPVLNERNPARIAGGFGGTLSLLMSVMLVVFSLAGVAIMTLKAARDTTGDQITVMMAVWLGGVVILNVVATIAALTVGIRNFNRLEC